MDISTTLTCRTSIFYTLASAYAVVLCVRAQGRIAADAKSVLRCCWHSRRISACLGAFARRWRLYVAGASETEGRRSTDYV